MCIPSGSPIFAAPHILSYLSHFLKSCHISSYLLLYPHIPISIFDIFRACASHLEARCLLLRTSWPRPPPPCRAWGSPLDCEVSSQSTAQNCTELKAPAPHHNWSAFNAIKALTLHWSWVLEAPHFVFSLWNAQNYTKYAGKGCKERDKTGWRMIFLNPPLSHHHFHWSDNEA